MRGRREGRDGKRPGVRAARRTASPLAIGAAILLGLAGPAGAQQPAGDRGGETAGEVTLDDFAWLAGTWRGPGPNGTTAEIHFMEPRAGGILSVFRLWKGTEVVTLETISLVEEPGGLVMYVRHFTPELVPMEKEGAIELRLVERRGEAFHFANAREGRNPRASVLTRTERGFASRSVLVGPDGAESEIRVEYERVE